MTCRSYITDSSLSARVSTTCLFACKPSFLFLIICFSVGKKANRSRCYNTTTSYRYANRVLVPVSVMIVCDDRCPRLKNIYIYLCIIIHIGPIYIYIYNTITRVHSKSEGQKNFILCDFFFFYGFYERFFFFYSRIYVRRIEIRQTFLSAKIDPHKPGLQLHCYIFHITYNII